MGIDQIRVSVPSVLLRLATAMKIATMWPCIGKPSVKDMPETGSEHTPSPQRSEEPASKGLPANTPHEELPKSREETYKEKMAGIDWEYIARELEDTHEQVRDYVLSGARTPMQSKERREPST